MFKILLTEGYTPAGIGDSAIRVAMVAELKKSIPDIEIMVLADDPEPMGELLGEKTADVLFPLPVLQSHTRRIMWLMPNLCWAFTNALFLLLTKIGFPYKAISFSKTRRRAIHAYCETDVVISCGGGYINDNNWMQTPFYLYGYWMAKMLEKPVVIYPQSIGPFYYKVSKVLAKHVLNKCDLIFLRDAGSMDELKNIGVSKPEIIVTADAAIALESAKPEIVHDLLVKAKVPTDNNVVVGMSVIKRQAGKYYEQYSSAMAQVADCLVSEHDAHIVFVSTNIRYRGYRTDDVASAKEVYEMMKNKDNATVLTHLYSPNELKGIIGEMDLMISSRMHACILATTMYVPTIVLNYEFKSSEYMKMLGLKDYSLDISEAKFENLKDLVDICLRDQDIVKETLHNKIPGLVKTSKKTSEYVRDFIFDKCGVSGEEQ